MTRSGLLGMGRTALFLVLGVIITGLFLSGLVWMTSLRERGWSNDPQIFGRQATFVVTVLAFVVGAFALNHVSGGMVQESPFSGNTRVLQRGPRPGTRCGRPL
jgi:hypothetical protein